ncbi:MAG TPA: hydrogenase expression/formation protein HypE [Chloroflexi bacterium]|nr:hydrogenase expression/formation protein HypE [Chloroflexota bacterium]
MKASGKVLLAHGGGGRLSRELIRELFLKRFGNPILDVLDDAAVLPDSLPKGYRLAFTTDSYVVQPLFFPGGDIGKLAVSGTVNDLAMMGARPLYLSAGFIIEEGFPFKKLEQVVDSMARTAQEAGVQIVAGDTKVVNKGSADGLFINTAGVGLIPPGVKLGGALARPGDVVIVSGPVGDHGIAVMMQREGLQFSSELRSDCAPLNGLVEAILKASKEVHCLRDPTRGGLAAVLNEIASQSNVGIEAEEEAIPIREEVKAVCEFLGLDPLYVACEGRLVAVVTPQAAEPVLEAMRRHPYGREACIIGRVVDEHLGKVVMRTLIGSRRILDMPAGEQLPRIC